MCNLGASTSKETNGRTMYYMIHASDHHRATRLMSEAYNAVNRASIGGTYQHKLYLEDMDSDG